MTEPLDPPRLFEPNEFHTALIPVRDGVSISVRRGPASE